MLLNQNTRSLAFLFVLFSLALVFPLSVVILGTGGQEGLLAVVPHLFGSSEGESSEASEFRDSLVVNRPLDFYAVPSSPDIEPAVGEDFVFFFWFKARHEPSFGDKVVIVEKVAGYGQTARGYSFGYVADQSQARPYVFWRGLDGKGSSYAFSEFTLNPKTWYLFSASFTDGKFLGVHVVPHRGRTAMKKGEAGQAELLGGYTLEEGPLPSNEANLILGADKNGSFRGKVGPFGIFRGAGLSKELPKILEELAVSPREIPGHVKSGQVKLFVADGKTDLSSSANKVRQKGVKAKGSLDSKSSPKNHKKTIKVKE